MILDVQSLFSENQAITGDAASTNVLDLGAPGTPVGGAAALAQDLGKGMPVPILIQVTEAFNNLTSLGVQVQTDDNEAFSSAKTVLTTTLALADLTAGKQFPLQFVPNGVDERYVRLNYDVTGTAPTTGQVTAGLSMGNQTNP